MASAEPPSTPPRQGLPPSIHLSSPVVRLPNFYDEHKRDQFQVFGYEVDIHEPISITHKEFLQFLECNFGRPKTAFKFTLSKFLDVANTMAESIKTNHFAQGPLLVFKNTGSKAPGGHVTETECKPDITAAFDIHWQNNTTLWPCVRLAGEKASEGKSKDDQRKQAVSYLHYLLLARPDFYVAQGMLISDDGVWFLLGISGVGIRSTTASWTSSKLPELVYACIYRLYSPAHFADPSYVDAMIDVPSNSVEYTVRITLSPTNTLDCPGFSSLFASHPFATRTHVLRNLSPQVQVNGQALSVIKDQLYRIEARFEEWSILKYIHEAVKVPGVIEAVYSETIVTPLSTGRQKHRLGLRQSGIPFMSIPTPQKVLETLFDVLEVLRYLRFERKVLHRDISKGNILYGSQPNSIASSPYSSLALGTNGDTLCFIKCLLGESDDPNETSALVIDFNRAEDLGRNQDPEHARIGRTGTPLFIARGVEMMMAVPLPERSVDVPAMLDSPAEYSLKHPARTKTFSSIEELVIPRSANKSNDKQWRHELEHDTESVFWLLLYWCMSSQPRGHPEELVDSTAWSQLTGDATKRIAMIGNLADNTLANVTHSHFKPLQTLIKSLAALLVVDWRWLDQSDKRNQPEYLAEAFQRLILAFILANRAKDFMDHPVERDLRPIQLVPKPEKKSSTALQAHDMGETKKRTSPQPSFEEGASKRPRRDPDNAEGGNTPVDAGLSFS